MRKNIPIAMILTLVVSINSYAQEIKVSLDSTHQTIRGFGGAFIEFWQPDLTAAHVQTAFGNGEGEMGLSILRLGINPDSTRWSENLEAAQKAQELGIIIFASPWNAPSNLLKEKISAGDPDTLAVANYAEYAHHLDDFNSYMQRNGVDIYTISIQNEPDYADGWTGWTSDNMVKFLRENAPSIRTKVMAPESFQFRREFTDPILEDSLATANTDIIGGHIYGGGNARYPLAEEKGKEVWMTEYLLNENTDGLGADDWESATDEQKWKQSLLMAYTVHKSMESNMQAYIWWYLKRYYSFLDDGTFRGINGEVTKRGYAFSHYSKYVRPGYVRIGSEGPFARGYTQVYSSAYTDTTTGEIILVALNRESSNKAVDFVVEGMNAATFTPIISTVDKTVEPLENIVVTGGAFSYTLPKESIITFVSSGLSVSNQEDGMVVPTQITLDQNYPNPFNPSTVISFQLPESNMVSLRVYDALGREVAELVNGVKSQGSHQINFNASELSSGMYLYRLKVGEFISTKKMLLLK